MSEIGVFDLSRLTKDELSGFMKDVLRMLNKNFEETPIWAEGFELSYAKLSRIMSTSPEDAAKASQDLQTADQLADSAWSNMNQYLKIMARHPNDVIASAVIRVKVVFDETENPTMLSYSVEYDMLERLIESLDLLDPATLNTSGIVPWLNELKSSVANFTALYKQRVQDKAAHIIGEGKAARQQCISEYRTMVQNANVVQRLSPSPELTGFITQVNILISQKRALLKARKTARLSASDDSSESISEE